MTEIYTLKKEFLSKYTENQLSDFLKDFKININITKKRLKYLKSLLKSINS